MYPIFRYAAIPAFLAATASHLLAQPVSFEVNPTGGEQAFTADVVAGYDLGTHPRGDQPYYLSFHVGPGTYRLDFVLGGATPTLTTIRAESRQLLLEGISVAANDTTTATAYVNVRNPSLAPLKANSPGGVHVMLNPREDTFLRWDDKLTLEINGSHPGVKKVTVTPADVPVVYLLGDSTVTDQNAEPGASWGQMLPVYLRGVVVANHAESGETMKSTVTALRFAKVLETLKAQDTVILQFGHNDQKRQWPQTYVEAGTTYKAWLRVFVEEIRARGATAVLCTSVERRNFDPAGKIKPSHGGYPQAVREVAAELQVPLIDLEADTRTFYEALGPELSPLAFSNGGKDLTHHNNYGAYQIARFVAQRLGRLPIALSKQVVNAEGFDPAHPMDPRAFQLPPSPMRTDVAPRGN